MKTSKTHHLNPKNSPHDRIHNACPMDSPLDDDPAVRRFQQKARMITHQFNDWCLQYLCRSEKIIKYHPHP